MRTWLARVAIGLITLFLALEAFALGFYAVTQGGFFYLAARPEALASAGGPAREDEAAHRAHPYFGFVKIAKSRPGFNNHGFPAARFDYPYARARPGQYLIGVFGGSVAEHFVRIGWDRLVERLEASPAFAGREIVALSFAQGGYKQPQQLLVLSYYLSLGQAFDMVLNIDGFNEQALGSRNLQNDLDVSMPSADHLLPLLNLMDPTTLTDARIHALSRITADKAGLEAARRGVARARLASEWFLLHEAELLESARLAREQVGFQELPISRRNEALMAVYPPGAGVSEAKLPERAAAQWANASILMNTLLAGRGVGYYHFLQPNQYFSKKRFSEEERRRALNPEHPYRAAAERGYPALLAEAGRLQASGVAFRSAVGIFDRQTATLYDDDCCHFNVSGNRLLADFIADAILEPRARSAVSALSPSP